MLAINAWGEEKMFFGCGKHLDCDDEEKQNVISLVGSIVIFRHASLTGLGEIEVEYFYFFDGRFFRANHKTVFVFEKAI